MKRLFTFAGIVLASIALVCTGCNKPTNETDPEAPENLDHIEPYDGLYNVLSDGTLELNLEKAIRDACYEFTIKDLNGRSHDVFINTTPGQAVEINSAFLSIPYEKWVNGYSLVNYHFVSKFGDGLLARIYI